MFKRVTNLPIISDIIGLFSNYVIGVISIFAILFFTFTLVNLYNGYLNVKHIENKYQISTSDIDYLVVHNGCISIIDADTNSVVNSHVFFALNEPQCILTPNLSNTLIENNFDVSRGIKVNGVIPFVVAFLGYVIFILLLIDVTRENLQKTFIKTSIGWLLVSCNIFLITYMAGTSGGTQHINGEIFWVRSVVVLDNGKYLEMPTSLIGKLHYTHKQNIKSIYDYN